MTASPISTSCARAPTRTSGSRVKRGRTRRSASGDRLCPGDALARGPRHAVFVFALAALGLLRRRVALAPRGAGRRVLVAARGLFARHAPTPAQRDVRRASLRAPPPPGLGGSAGEGGALPEVAGSGGSLSAGGASVTVGGAPGADAGAGAPQALISGCPDLDGDKIADCTQTLVTNADFKSNVDGWSAELDATIAWDAKNAAGDPPSGSALLASTGAIAPDSVGAALRAASQCLSVAGARLVTVYANAFVDGGQDTDGHAEVDVFPSSTPRAAPARRPRILRHLSRWMLRSTLSGWWCRPEPLAAPTPSRCW